jgi:hypothetical protein
MNLSKISVCKGLCFRKWHATIVSSQCQALARPKKLARQGEMRRFAGIIWLLSVLQHDPIEANVAIGGSANVGPVGDEVTGAGHEHRRADIRPIHEVRRDLH